MKRLHIIGRKNHGKTTLIVELVDILSRRGLRVGTIKHTHHRHELDTPGKDSHRHRQAGAAFVGILSPDLNAAFWMAPTTTPHDERYAAFEPLHAHCDLVLVEGDTETAGDKIEVWREGIGGAPWSCRIRRCLPSSATIARKWIAREFVANRWTTSSAGLLPG